MHLGLWKIIELVSRILGTAAVALAAAITLVGCNSSTAPPAAPASPSTVSLAGACPRVAAIMAKEPTSIDELRAMAQKMNDINGSPHAEAMTAPIAAGLESAANVPLGNGEAGNATVGVHLQSPRLTPRHRHPADFRGATYVVLTHPVSRMPRRRFGFQRGVMVS